MDDMIQWLTISNKKKSGTKWTETMNTDLLAALGRIDDRLADQFDTEF